MQVREMPERVMTMRLYSFFNSSTSYRVRIALALKGVSYETVPVNIRVGEQRDPGYLGPINVSAGVPVLEVDGRRIAQSLAIIDYLDSLIPEPPLLPADPFRRAEVLSLANVIACDMHPLNNLRVLRYLQQTFGVSDADKDGWYQHWIAEGFSAVEAMLGGADGGSYCFGHSPTLADCCLVPQVANALRMKCSLKDYPKVMAVYNHAIAQSAFQQAAPERQPDYTA
jgi:maleylacetoacetate isomerase